MIDQDTALRLCLLDKKCPGIEIVEGEYSGCTAPAFPADCPVCCGPGRVPGRVYLLDPDGKSVLRAPCRSGVRPLMFIGDQGQQPVTDDAEAADQHRFHQEVCRCK